jgi:hypothetical protein
MVLGCKLRSAQGLSEKTSIDEMVVLRVNAIKILYNQFITVLVNTCWGMSDFRQSGFN